MNNLILLAVFTCLLFPNIDSQCDVKPTGSLATYSLSKASVISANYIGLSATNIARKSCNASNMALNTNTSYSTELYTWVNRVAHNGTLAESSGAKSGLYGESSYFICLYGTTLSKNITWLTSTAVQNWYAEIDSYNYSSPGYVPSNAHFTALVWNSSVQTLFAVVVTNVTVNSTCFFQCGWVYARYYPAGNVLADFKQNVFPNITQPDWSKVSSSAPSG